VRFNCPPEITLHRLMHQAGGKDRASRDLAGWAAEQSPAWVGLTWKRGSWRDAACVLQGVWQGPPTSHSRPIARVRRETQRSGGPLRRRTGAQGRYAPGRNAQQDRATFRRYAVTRCRACDAPRSGLTCWVKYPTDPFFHDVRYWRMTRSGQLPILGSKCEASSRRSTTTCGTGAWSWSDLAIQSRQPFALEDFRTSCETRPTGESLWSDRPQNPGNGLFSLCGSPSWRLWAANHRRRWARWRVVKHSAEGGSDKVSVQLFPILCAFSMNQEDAASHSLWAISLAKFAS